MPRHRCPSCGCWYFAGFAQSLNQSYILHPSGMSGTQYLQSFTWHPPGLWSSFRWRQKCALAVLRSSSARFHQTKVNKIRHHLRKIWVCWSNYSCQNCSLDGYNFKITFFNYCCILRFYHLKRWMCWLKMQQYKMKNNSFQEFSNWTG